MGLFDKMKDLTDPEKSKEAMDLFQNKINDFQGKVTDFAEGKEDEIPVDTKINEIVSADEENKSTDIVDVSAKEPSRTAFNVNFYDEDRVFTLNVSKGLFKKELKTVRYNQIISYELIEDGTTSYSGGLGRAAVGALTFGAAGAIVGGITGKKKQKSKCSSLSVNITLRDDETTSLNIPFIVSETKVGSIMYTTLKQSAAELVKALEVAVDIAERDNNQTTVVMEQTSAADEIRKFKQLLDDGIISEEEFDEKKKQLLGL